MTVWDAGLPQSSWINRNDGKGLVYDKGVLAGPNSTTFTYYFYAHECATCPYGQTPASMCSRRGVDTTCKACTQCDSTTQRRISICQASIMVDTVCMDCNTKCSAGNKIKKACDGLSPDELICEPCEPCAPGFYASSGCTGTDNIGYNCTRCPQHNASDVSDGYLYFPPGCPVNITGVSIASALATSGADAVSILSSAGLVANSSGPGTVVYRDRILYQNNTIYVNNTIYQNTTTTIVINNTVYETVPVFVNNTVIINNTIYELVPIYINNTVYQTTPIYINNTLVINNTVYQMVPIYINNTVYIYNYSTSVLAGDTVYVNLTETRFRMCTDCVLGSTFENPLFPCGGANGTSDRQCSACSPACVSGSTFEASPCSLFSDRACASCTPSCAANQYRVSGCNTTHDTVCSTCRASCPAWQYKVANCTATADITCAPCACAPNGTESCVPADGGLGTGIGAGETCKCKAGWTGQYCDRCATGYFGGACDVRCRCSEIGTRTDTTCSASTGQCTCKTGFAGFFCDDCAPGLYGADCSSTCDCVAGHGSCSAGINGTGVCTCAFGWTGSRCETAVSSSGAGIYNGLSVDAPLIWTEGAFRSSSIPATAFTVVIVGGNGAPISSGISASVVILTIVNASSSGSAVISPPWLAITQSQSSPSGFALSGQPSRWDVTTGADGSTGVTHVYIKAAMISDPTVAYTIAIPVAVGYANRAPQMSTLLPTPVLNITSGGGGINTVSNTYVYSAVVPLRIGEGFAIAILQQKQQDTPAVASVTPAVFGLPTSSSATRLPPSIAVIDLVDDDGRFGDAVTSLVMDNSSNSRPAWITGYSSSSPPPSSTGTQPSVLTTTTGGHAWVFTGYPPSPAAGTAPTLTIIATDGHGATCVLSIGFVVSGNAADTALVVNASALPALVLAQQGSYFSFPIPSSTFIASGGAAGAAVASYDVDVTVQARRVLLSTTSSSPSSSPSSSLRGLIASPYNPCAWINIGTTPTNPGTSSSASSPPPPLLFGQPGPLDSGYTCIVTVTATCVSGYAAQFSLRVSVTDVNGE